MVLKKTNKRLFQLGTGLVGLGIGSALVSKAGSVSGTSANLAPIQEGFGTAGSLLGTVGGGVIALTALKEMQPKRKKQLNRRRILF